MPKTSDINRLLAEYVSQAGLTRVYVGVQAQSTDTVSGGQQSRATVPAGNDLLTPPVLCVFVVIRMEQALLFTLTPAHCRALHLGARRDLPPATPAAWSCSAPEPGLTWSVKPPCFSSVSFQRAGDEGEEGGPLHRHESRRHSETSV